MTKQNILKNKTRTKLWGTEEFIDDMDTAMSRTPKPQPHEKMESPKGKAQRDGVCVQMLTVCADNVCHSFTSEYL